MNTRSYKHIRTVTLWLQLILTNVLLLGVLWYMDAHDIHWIKQSWTDWVIERHFLLKISIFMLYFIVVWKIIGVWYKICGWISILLIKWFYK